MDFVDRGQRYTLSRSSDDGSRNRNTCLSVVLQLELWVWSNWGPRTPCLLRPAGFALVELGIVDKISEANGLM